MTVIENLPVGFRIMQFTAVDRDTGDNAEFVYPSLYHILNFVWKHLLFIYKKLLRL